MTDPPTRDTVEQVAEARGRARLVLQGEARLGTVSDLRRVLHNSRDALLVLWLTWVGLQAFQNPPFTGYLLVALAIVLALLIGMSAARSTHNRLQFYAAELERERTEIQQDAEHEREEIRAMYAAKGFSDPVLGQIVDTLSADDDRLLKVMMEEELGLFVQHVQHPLVVGVWNFLGTAAAGLALSVGVVLLPAEAARVWVVGGGAVILAVLSLIARWTTGRSALEFFTSGMVMAVVSGGVMYYLAQWLAGFVLGEATGK